MSQCQICNHSPLRHVISLGYMPPVNWMVPIDEPAKEQTWLPTDLMYCPECQLVQLDYIADSNIVFPDHYPYTSGSTKILRDNFEDLAKEATDLLDLKVGSWIMDIGSNDGTLLNEFKKLGMNVMGWEPTDIADIAEGNGIPTIKTFFSKTAVEYYLKKNGRQCDLVTCTNCFAHMPDINDVVTGIKALLKPEGTFISENHYLIELLNGLQYDTIYHEHLRYYSLRALHELLFLRHNLWIFAAKKISTHGGSIRVYACNRDDYGKIDKKWNTTHLYTAEPSKKELAKKLQKFSKDVLQPRRDLISTVHRLKTQGRVVGIGAPSRASTVINYCRLDVDLIDY